MIEALIFIIAPILLAAGIWAGNKATNFIVFNEKPKDFNTIALELLKNEKIEELEELRATSPNWILNLDNADLSNLNLSRLNLSGLNLERVNFTGSNLAFADLRNSSFLKCIFVKSKLIDVQFNFSVVDSCAFNEALIENTDFSHSKLIKSNFSSSKQIQNEFTGAEFFENEELNMEKNQYSGYSYSKENIPKIIYDIKQNSALLFELNPSTLEKIVAELLKRFQYKTEVAQSGKDSGFDILAWKEGVLGKEMVLIEVKRTPYNKKVGLSSVKALYASKLRERATKAILITPSTYTLEARVFAKELNDLSLIEGNQLLGWIREYT
ncbi:hypothetical protein GTQ34_05695 [Muricauda sp. JGD-17]|uniref:Restriction endonuclease type IV Mrr domain-containing protein n=1 Tax=Flagellimonas ochracea TaxID=2696472 RepID=A0A964TAQ8_9FLAO|nr:restriction endonuclease [Allomuricauda ochracea]NAY91407.1 hypothetical protein [Allomuricauda ochracea]